MTKKTNKPGKEGAVELTEEEAKAVGGGSKLTGESLTSSPGGISDTRVDPKKKNIVQAYPAVEYD